MLEAGPDLIWVRRLGAVLERPRLGELESLVPFGALFLGLGQFFSVALLGLGFPLFIGDLGVLRGDGGGGSPLGFLGRLVDGQFRALAGRLVVGLRKELVQLVGNPDNAGRGLPAGHVGRKSRNGRIQRGRFLCGRSKPHPVAQFRDDGLSDRPNRFRAGLPGGGHQEAGVGLRIHPARFCGQPEDPAGDRDAFLGVRRGDETRQSDGVHSHSHRQIALGRGRGFCSGGEVLSGDADLPGHLVDPLVHPCALLGSRPLSHAAELGSQVGERDRRVLHFPLGVDEALKLVTHQTDGAGNATAQAEGYAEGLEHRQRVLAEGLRKALAGLPALAAGRLEAVDDLALFVDDALHRREGLRLVAADLKDNLGLGHLSRSVSVVAPGPGARGQAMWVGSVSPGRRPSGGRSGPGLRRGVFFFDDLKPRR